MATESEQSLSSSHPNLSFLIFPFSHVQAPRTIFSFSLSLSPLYNIMNKKAAAAGRKVIKILDDDGGGAALGLLFPINSDPFSLRRP